MYDKINKIELKEIDTIKLQFTTNHNNQNTIQKITSNLEEQDIFIEQFPIDNTIVLTDGTSSIARIKSNIPIESKKEIVRPKRKYDPQKVERKIYHLDIPINELTADQLLRRTKYEKRMEEGELRIKNSTQLKIPQSKSNSTIEVYGINQVGVNDESIGLLNEIPKLPKSQSVMLCKLDIPGDIYHDDNLTYTLYPGCNILDQIKSKKNNIVFINGFVTTNIFIPIEKKNSVLIKQIKKAIRHKKSKAKDFYIYAKKSKYLEFTSYKNQSSESADTTHLKVVFRTQSNYYKWINKLKEEDFIIEYGTEEEIDLKINKKPTSIIQYNKHEKFIKELKQDELELDKHYLQVAENYYNESEQEIARDNMKWSRNELRFMFSNADNLLVYNEDGTINTDTFNKLRTIIKREVSKIKMVLFKNNNKLSEFKKDYMEQPTKALNRINMYAKTIEFDEADVDTIIDNLMKNLCTF